MSIGGDALLKEPWSSSCALLVFPGGADLGYCQTLNGEGCRRITQYVARGGSYLGFCAGAYFASGFCEFEKGNKKLEVIGERELGFFPGICRGLAFAGFQYGSEVGAKAVNLRVSKGSLNGDDVPDSFLSYYNGGGVFVDAPLFEGTGVEILASYTQDLKVDSGQGSAAVIFSKIDSGSVVLSCTHPEYDHIHALERPS